MKEAFPAGSNRLRALQACDPLEQCEETLEKQCATGSLVRDVSASPDQVHVSAFCVRALVDVLRARGVPRSVLLEGQPIEPAGRLSLSEFQAMLSRAAQLTDDPGLALACGLHAAESSFGLISPLIAHASSLRDALGLLGRFQPLILEWGRLRASEHAGVATLHCEFGLPGQSLEPRLIELIVAGLTRLLYAFGCPRSGIHAVCFEHARPAYHAAYTRAFDGKERFGQAYVGIELASELLDQPHLHADPELVSALRAEAERALERLLRPLGWTERVLRVMRRQPELAALDASCVASQFGLSDRSLRRHLRDEGASYRALACSVLRESACAMLRDGVSSIQHVADVLGFADTTAFHRAFKRWTGLTPAEYRVMQVRSLC